MFGVRIMSGDGSRSGGDVDASIRRFGETSTGADTRASKCRPAEPEALRLLAHQRGLIATGESQKQAPRSAEHPGTCGQDPENCVLRDLSYFCRPPAGPGDLLSD